MRNEIANDKSWLKNLSLIIWDLDGTLYPITTELRQKISRNVNNLIAEAGNINLDQAQALHQDLYSRLHSNTKTLIAAGVDRETAMGGSWYTSAQLEAVQSNLELIKSIRQLDSVKHIINTNSPQRQAEKKLQKLGFHLSDFETVIGNPDTIGKQKPDLAPYKYILNLFQVPEEEYLVVGDRYETDLAPAKQLGMHTAVVYDRDDRADLSFESTAKLLDFLEQN